MLPELDDIDADAEDRAFKALGHAERRAMLRVIGGDELSVGDVCSATGAAQPTVSQHLRVLRDAGLVTVRADGTRRLYSLDFSQIAHVRSTLDVFWNSKLVALKDVAERSEPSPGETAGSAGGSRRAVPGASP